MANAIPVNSKSAKLKDPEIEVIPHGETSSAELLARAKEIVASQVPAQILDEQVNQVGQLSAYGKIKLVQELPYDVVNRKGEPTGEVRTALRIDH